VWRKKEEGRREEEEGRGGSLSVDQSAGSLAVTEAFGPEVLGVARCEGEGHINML